MTNTTSQTTADRKVFFLVSADPTITLGYDMRTDYPACSHGTRSKKKALEWLADYRKYNPFAEIALVSSSGCVLDNTKELTFETEELDDEQLDREMLVDWAIDQDEYSDLVLREQGVIAKEALVRELLAQDGRSAEVILHTLKSTSEDKLTFFQYRGGSKISEHQASSVRDLQNATRSLDDGDTFRCKETAEWYSYSGDNWFQQMSLQDMEKKIKK